MTRMRKVTESYKYYFKKCDFLVYAHLTNELRLKLYRLFIVTSVNITVITVFIQTAQSLYESKIFQQYGIGSSANLHSLISAFVILYCL